MNLRPVRHARLVTAGVIVVLVLAITASFYVTNRKLRVCPEAWYQDRMPSVSGGNNEYFVFKDKRVDVENVDVGWVEANCKVNKPRAVY